MLSYFTGFIYSVTDLTCSNSRNEAGLTKEKVAVVAVSMKRTGSRDTAQGDHSPDNYEIPTCPPNSLWHLSMLCYPHSAYTTVRTTITLCVSAYSTSVRTVI